MKGDLCLLPKCYDEVTFPAVTNPRYLSFNGKFQTNYSIKIILERYCYLSTCFDVQKGPGLRDRLKVMAKVMIKVRLKVIFITLTSHVLHAFVHGEVTVILLTS